ncbi:MAG: hypothetical protein WAV90_00585 [Gordonia amarae]
MSDVGDRFTCDGGRIADGVPMEQCSLHGRTPAELRGMYAAARSERDAALAEVARLRTVVRANFDLYCEARAEEQRWRDELDIAQVDVSITQDKLTELRREHALLKEQNHADFEASATVLSERDEARAQLRIARQKLDRVETMVYRWEQFGHPRAGEVREALR